MRDYHEAAEEWEIYRHELAVEESLVCELCVEDEYLWAAIQASAGPGVCSFCARRGRCVSFGEIAPEVEAVVNQFYVTWAESGAYHDDGESSEDVHDIQNIVEELLLGAVHIDALGPLAMFVIGRDDTDYGWVRQRDVWGRLHDFESHKWERFMNDSRKTGSLVDGQALGSLEPETVDLLNIVVRVAIDQGLFKTASPRLWRCRVRNEGPLVTAKQLGSPPAAYAKNNRMTKAEDSVFYGSETKPGAVAEVFQHEAAQDPFCIGCFEPTAPLYYLDVADLPEPPSPFRENAAETIDALYFLRRFAKTVSQPNDGADRHYVPTQVFTYFLRDLHEELRPDALRFASSLNSEAPNWVVFFDNAHCIDPDEAIDEPALRLVDNSTQCFETLDDLV